MSFNQTLQQLGPSSACVCVLGAVGGLGTMVHHDRGFGRITFFATQLLDV